MVIICSACHKSVYEDATGVPICLDTERLCGECLNNHTTQCHTCFNN